MDIEEWLKQYTVTCPVGKVSKRQCENLKQRPALKDAKKALNAYYTTPIRPLACDSCPGWAALKRQQKIKQRKQQIRTQVRRMAGYKRCNACKKMLPLEAFYRDRTKKDGRKTQCKMCIKRKRQEKKLRNT